MATSAEIREKAARKLGVLGVGQTLRSEISDDLDEAYTEVYRELESDDMALWEIDEEVPDQFVWPVVAMVAYRRAVEYGVPQERFVRIAGDQIIAESRIKRLQAPAKMGQTEIEYF